MSEYSYEDGYDEGVEAGREFGHSEGYDEGYKDAACDYEKKIGELEYNHTKDLESSYKDGYNEAEDRFDRELSSIQYNMEEIIIQFQNKIKELNKTVYDLRKENAAITRTICKST